MRLLLVAASSPEIEPLLNSLDSKEGRHASGKPTIDVLITGVGMVATAFALGNYLAGKHYDLAINLGIAGSFDRTIALGETVLVEDDCFAELGAENGDDFITIDEMGFGEAGGGRRKSEVGSPESEVVSREWVSVLGLLETLKKVKGITVNKVHGNSESISKIVTRLHPQTESMEGAAFFYACNFAGIPAVQVRAISNYVELRNKSNWNIPLAIKNLNTFAAQLIRIL